MSKTIHSAVSAASSVAAWSAAVAVAFTPAIVLTFHNAL